MSTGVSDLAPFERNLEFIRAVLPNARTIGLPYNPEDQPAVFGVQQIKSYAPKYGFSIVTKQVSSLDDMMTIAMELARSTDCILIGSDNLMFEAAPTLVKAAMSANKPVFAGDSTSIKAGAVAGFTIDYYDVGKAGASLVAAIVNGKNAGELPVVILNEGVFELNQRALDQLHMQIPPEYRKLAHVVYGEE